MAPTIITGTEADRDFPAVQTNQIDVDERIALLEGSKTLFAPIAQRTQTQAAHGQKKEWLEDEVVPIYTAAAASFTSSATSFPLAAGTGSYYSPNDIIRNELTGENMLVTSVATDTPTVVRGFGSVAGTASSGSADGIIRVGNASPQGASYPMIKDTQVVGQYNYQQIFRKSIGLVTTATKEDFRGESDAMAYKKNKGLLDILRQTDNTLFLGRRNSTTASTSNHGTQSQLTMGGFTDYIATNITASVGTLTMSIWESWLNNKAFLYGDMGQNKLVVISPIVATAINGFAAGKLAIPSVDQNKWGVNIRRYQTALGDVDLFVHKEWGKYSAAASNNNSLGGSAFALDMSLIYMSGLRKLDFLTDRQNPGDDAKVNEWLQETTLVFKQERRHAKMTGVTG